jgi:hypothetical protein
LFERLVLEPGASAERQEVFHHHAWPGRPEVSVLMSRADARTVSIATLEISDSDGGVRMEYEPVPDLGLAAVMSGMPAHSP